MREYTLRLYNNEERIDLPLYPAGSPQVLSEIVAMPKEKVFFDRTYDGQLLSSHTWDIENLEVQVNNYPVSMSFYKANGTIRFSESAGQRRIFSDCFGLCQFKLLFSSNEGLQILESVRFQVMVHPSEENQAIGRMGNYVAARNGILLYGTESDYSRAPQFTARQGGSMEDKVRLLQRMTLTLESCWRWIRTNPRVQTSENDGIKVGSSQSVRYLATHPEMLHESNALHGIRIGRHSYLPSFPEKQSARASTDVYENQVILAFLKAVYEDIRALEVQLHQAKNDLPTRVEEREGYISSSFFMVSASRQAMENLQKDLETLDGEFSRLYEAYHSAIPAGEIVLNSMPAPTPAFTSLPAYRRIFEDIHNWFSLRAVSAQDMRFMETFLQITTLYEVFVLSRLLAFFQEAGFELVSARTHHYELDQEALYKNTSINNVFVYRRQGIQVTVYYQPVIYDAARKADSLVGLYRNTALSFPKGWAEPSRGKYYTPDYLIEISSDEFTGRRYILGDAKYTNLHNVQAYKVIPLVYKYLFSLSCYDPGDRITGLYIFQGKSVNQNKEIVHSIYNLAPNPHSVFPQTEIISLAREDEKSHTRQHESLLALLSLQFAPDLEHPQSASSTSEDLQVIDQEESGEDWTGEDQPAADQLETS